MSGQAADPALLAAARALAVDATTAEVVRAFDGAGVESILLKGPVMARLLDLGDRPYGDADLLVPVRRRAFAEAELAILGFVPVADIRPELISLHAQPWRRSRDGAVVDLHHTIWGSGLQPRDTFSELRRWTAPLAVGGHSVAGLLPSAASLMVALHAAQHGPDEPKPLDDLRRALAVVPRETWVAAEGLADRLLAVLPFGRGLCLLPEGGALARELPLVAAALDAPQEDRVTGAIAAARWRATATRPRRAVLAWRYLRPEGSRMRAAYPLARHGPAGLAAARLIRLVRLTTGALARRVRP